MVGVCNCVVIMVVEVFVNFCFCISQDPYRALCGRDGCTLNFEEN